MVLRLSQEIPLSSLLPVFNFSLDLNLVLVQRFVTGGCDNLVKVWK